MEDYFKLLNMEKIYELDLKMLDKQYFAMQVKYHPDNAKSNVDKQDYLVISSRINKAYLTLKNDLKRAEYFLLLDNIVLESPGIRKNISQEQLNNIWDDLELVENTQELDRLKDFLRIKNHEKQELVTSLALIFNTKNIQLAINMTIKLKYLVNLINEIQAKMKLCKN